MEEIENLLSVFDSINLHSDTDIARLLKPLYPSNPSKGHTAILFFFYSGNNLHRVLFEAGDIKEQVDFTVSREELLKLNSDIIRSLGVYNLQESRKPKLRSVIEDDDTNMIVPPLEVVIGKASKLLLPNNFDRKYGHLVIIPALGIGSFPFHLLKPYGDSTLLIEGCSFSIAPGLFDLLLMRWKYLKQKGVEVLNLYKQEGEGKVTGSTSDPGMKSFDGIKSFNTDRAFFVSDPAYPTDTRFHFPPLPGARQEVNNAIKYVKNYKLLAGSDATRDSVIHYLDGADIAYFATHGISDADSPMEKSFLVLSGKNPFLSAKDIMDLRNKKAIKTFPELVILSACQTGLGKPVDAGIAGLARAFLLGGSNSVVMSLWNVDDEATAYLMNRFFLYLKHSSRNIPAGAMRRAVLETRKKYPHPSQWASFSLFGIDL
jgi:CHAT domain-containing protein